MGSYNEMMTMIGNFRKVPSVIASSIEAERQYRNQYVAGGTYNQQQAYQQNLGTVPSPTSSSPTTPQSYQTYGSSAQQVYQTKGGGSPGGASSQYGQTMGWGVGDNLLGGSGDGRLDSENLAIGEGGAGGSYQGLLPYGTDQAYNHPLISPSVTSFKKGGRIHYDDGGKKKDETTVEEFNFTSWDNLTKTQQTALLEHFSLTEGYEPNGHLVTGGSGITFGSGLDAKALTTEQDFIDHGVSKEDAKTIINGLKYTQTDGTVYNMAGKNMDQIIADTGLSEKELKAHVNNITFTNTTQEDIVSLSVNENYNNNSDLLNKVSNFEDFTVLSSLIHFTGDSHFDDTGKHINRSPDLEGGTKRAMQINIASLMNKHEGKLTSEEFNSVLHQTKKIVDDTSGIGTRTDAHSKGASATFNRMNKELNYSTNTLGEGYEYDETKFYTIKLDDLGDVGTNEKKSLILYDPTFVKPGVEVPEIPGGGIDYTIDPESGESLYEGTEVAPINTEGTNVTPTQEVKPNSIPTESGGGETGLNLPTNPMYQLEVPENPYQNPNLEEREQSVNLPIDTPFVGDHGVPMSDYSNGGRFNNGGTIPSRKERKTYGPPAKEGIRESESTTEIILYQGVPVDSNNLRRYNDGTLVNTATGEIIDESKLEISSQESSYNLSSPGGSPHYVNRTALGKLFHKNDMKPIDLRRRSDWVALQKEAEYAGFDNIDDFMIDMGYFKQEGQWYPDPNQEFSYDASNKTVDGKETEIKVITDMSNYNSSKREVEEKGKPTTVVEVGPLMTQEEIDAELLNTESQYGYGGKYTKNPYDEGGVVDETDPPTEEEKKSRNYYRSKSSSGQGAFPRMRNEGLRHTQVNKDVFLSLSMARYYGYDKEINMTSGRRTPQTQWETMRKYKKSTMHHYSDELQEIVSDSTKAHGWNSEEAEKEIVNWLAEQENKFINGEITREEFHSLTSRHMDGSAGDFTGDFQDWLKDGESGKNKEAAKFIKDFNVKIHDEENHFHVSFNEKGEDISLNLSESNQSLYNWHSEQFKDLSTPDETSGTMMINMNPSSYQGEQRNLLYGLQDRPLDKMEVQDVSLVPQLSAELIKASPHPEAYMKYRQEMHDKESKTIGYRLAQFSGGMENYKTPDKFKPLSYEDWAKENNINLEEETPNINIDSKTGVSESSYNPLNPQNHPEISGQFSQGSNPYGFNTGLETKRWSQAERYPGPGYTPPPATTLPEMRPPDNPWGPYLPIPEGVPDNPWGWGPYTKPEGVPDNPWGWGPYTKPDPNQGMWEKFEQFYREVENHSNDIKNMVDGTYDVPEELAPPENSSIFPY